MIQWPTRGLRGKVFGLGAVMLLAVALAGHLTLKDVQAQTYPVKPITIVNPWGPGAIPDLFSRTLSPQLSKLFGVPIDVISRPGGSGIVGSHSVMAAAPDGYTVLADNPGTSSMYLGWDVKLPYKEEEKTYMVRAAVVKQVIVVPTSTLWKTLGDMEQAIRKDPESFC
jgi:tripartite-type tricarboxylate transporter receptor subunit TctC